MKRHYTFDEVYRYAQEVRDTEEDFWNAIRRHDVEAKNQYQTQLHTMREVLLRMHEHIDKYGSRKVGLLRRWLAVREIRKATKPYRPSLYTEGILNHIDKDPQKLKVDRF